MLDQHQLPSCARTHSDSCGTDGLAKDPAVVSLQQRVQAAMQLPADGKVEFVKLHDALTTLRTHSKQVCCSCTSLWMASLF